MHVLQCGNLDFCFFHAASSSTIVALRVLQELLARLLLLHVGEKVGFVVCLAGCGVVDRGREDVGVVTTTSAFLHSHRCCVKLLHKVRHTCTVAIHN